jgi:hypothetical protein
MKEEIIKISEAELQRVNQIVSSHYSACLIVNTCSISYEVVFML